MFKKLCLKKPSPGDDYRETVVVGGLHELLELCQRGGVLRDDG